MGEAVVMSGGGGGGGGEMGVVVLEEKHKDTSKKEIAFGLKDGEDREKLLPRMVLRVLLVEADDSTRQIIAALLRKCSYRVATVPDGLKAWETLTGRPHSIDLVLTEVELPLMPGYALLTLIMEHEICKNIPVIMMSSKDSVSMVLKCMLKGAADFLIKPVRRNELRNLWQHVWRRQIICQSAGNHTRNKVLTHEKDEASSENNVPSNHSSDSLTFIQKENEFTVHGSDALGLSHMKHENESHFSNDEKHEESFKMIDQSTMKSEPKDTANPGKQGCNSYTIGVEEVCLRAKAMGKGTDVWPDHYLENAYKSDDANCQLNDFADPPCEAFNLIGKIENRVADIDRNDCASYRREKPTVAPKLELSLRSSYASSPKFERTREQQMLNHSRMSAFSKYGNKTLQPLSPMLAVNCTPPEDGSSASWEHADALMNNQENMTTLVLGQIGNTNSPFLGTTKLGVIPVPGVALDCIPACYNYIYPSIYDRQPEVPQVWSPKSQHEESTFPNSSIHSTSEVQELQYIFHSFDDNIIDAAKYIPEIDDKKLTGGKTQHRSPTLGSSDLGNGTTSKLSSSLCGSICTVDENSKPDVGEGSGAMSESVNENLTLVLNMPRGNNLCTNRREAAILKFRLKRKDRCYEKKVRYQSRKRLAEQRPRVKGQFVRQGHTEVLA